MPDELTEQVNVTIRAVGGMYRLYVDGHLLAERDYTQPVREESLLRLAPGEHEFVVDFDTSQEFTVEPEFNSGVIISDEQDSKTVRVKFKI